MLPMYIMLRHRDVVVRVGVLLVRCGLVVLIVTMFLLVCVLLIVFEYVSLLLSFAVFLVLRLRSGGDSHRKGSGEPLFPLLQQDHLVVIEIPQGIWSDLMTGIVHPR